MAREWNPNLKILELAVAELGELADEMVFVGGCATGLLITDPAAPAIRFTQDVDAIVQVVSVQSTTDSLKSYVQNILEKICVRLRHYVDGYLTM